MVNVITDNNEDNSKKLRQKFCGFKWFLQYRFIDGTPGNGSSFDTLQWAVYNEIFFQKRFILASNKTIPLFNSVSFPKGLYDHILNPTSLKPTYAMVLCLQRLKAYYRSTSILSSGKQRISNEVLLWKNMYN